MFGYCYALGWTILDTDRKLTFPVSVEFILGDLSLIRLQEVGKH